MNTNEVEQLRGEVTALQGHLAELKRLLLTIAYRAEHSPTSARELALKGVRLVDDALSIDFEKGFQAVADAIRSRRPPR